MPISKTPARLNPNTKSRKTMMATKPGDCNWKPQPISAPPARNPEADTARAHLRDRRRDCMGCHWPTVRIEGNAHEEPFDLPISLLWDQGVGQGTAGGHGSAGAEGVAS